MVARSAPRLPAHVAVTVLLLCPSGQTRAASQAANGVDLLRRVVPDKLRMDAIVARHTTPQQASGGRSWWAQLACSRMNTHPTIRQNQLEDVFGILESAIRGLADDLLMTNLQERRPLDAALSFCLGKLAIHCPRVPPGPPRSVRLAVRLAVSFSAARSRWS